MLSTTETAILARLAQQLAADSVLLGTTNRQGFNHER